MSSFPLTNSYFSRWLVNHQPDDVAKPNAINHLKFQLKWLVGRIGGLLWDLLWILNGLTWIDCIIIGYDRTGTHVIEGILNCQEMGGFVFFPVKPLVN